MQLVEKVKEHAFSLGFSLAGVTTPAPPPHWQAFQNWLALGRNASMEYLHDERRANPRLVMPECKSILVLGMRYPGTPTINQGQSNSGQVAAYAQGDDYHSIIQEKLKTLVNAIELEVGESIQHRVYTDTGPLLERDLAQRAGLGWIGKNTCLIHPEIGSFFFLAEILLDLYMECDPPFTADRCGTCTRCIEACPTGCILPDRTLDAGRCISYLTIENKGDIPIELRSRMGGWIFGCDVCQQVCPWNQDLPPLRNTPFKPGKDIPPADLKHELAISPREFNMKYKNSPVQRARRKGYRRNILVAMGNLREAAFTGVIESTLTDEDDLIRRHAEWALDEIRKG